MNNLVSIAPLQGDYLAHHQTKGAKWGVMHGPPYPLSRDKGPKKIKKVSKEAIKRVEKQAEEGIPGAEKKKAELRKYIVEHPKKLYKNKDMFSREELEDILKEIDFDRKLKDVKRNEFKRFVDTAKDVSSLAISIKNIGDSAVGTYKAAKNISDILNKRGEFAQSSSSDSKTKNDPKQEAPKTESKPKQEAPKTESKPKQEAPKTENKPKQEEPKEDKERKTRKGADFLSRLGAANPIMFM